MFVNELWDREYYQKILHNSQLLQKVRNIEEQKPKNKEEIFTNFNKHFSMKHAAERSDYYKKVLGNGPGSLIKTESGFFTSRDDTPSPGLKEIVIENGKIPTSPKSPRRALTSQKTRGRNLFVICYL